GERMRAPSNRWYISVRVRAGPPREKEVQHSRMSSPVPREGEADQCLLLDRVRLRRACGGACARRTPHGSQVSLARETAEDRTDEAEAAHVGRLLLNPDDLGTRRMPRELLREVLFRERVELLETHDGDPPLAALFALGAKLVGDLPRADEDLVGP